MIMPIKIERLTYLPVLLFTYSGAITLQEMVDAYYQSLALLTPDDHVMYRVVHVESLESNFAEILKMAQSNSSTTPPPSADTNRQLPLVVVGHDKWTKLYLQLMSQQQFGGVSIPCFVTIDQALEYIQAEMAES
jgi:hypothetical protein